MQCSIAVKAAVQEVFYRFPTAIARCKSIPGLAEDQTLKAVGEITLGGRFFACNDDFSKWYLYGRVIDFEHHKLVRLAGPFNLDGRCVLATVTIRFEEAGEETRVTITQDAFGAVDDALTEKWQHAWLDVLEILRLGFTGSEHERFSDSDADVPNYFLNVAKEALFAFQADLKRGGISRWIELALDAEVLATEASSEVVREIPKVIEKRKATKSSGQQSARFTGAPSEWLEETYQNLQSQLIAVRQAVAHSIATQKQLEQQIQKNKELAATWQSRAHMAVQRKNQDLVNQAKQRQQQYLDAVVELELQLEVQTRSSQELRRKLTELESHVQKAYTKKQILIARDKAATASIRADEILSRTKTDDALNKISQYEQEVQARECTAKELAHKRKESESSSEQPSISTEQLVTETTEMLALIHAAVTILEKTLRNRVDEKPAEVLLGPVDVEETNSAGNGT